MGSPTAEPAQPRALVGGHLVSTAVGLLALKLLGPDVWVAAVAVGLAMVAMHLTGTFHPPAGIDPLIVVVNGMPLSFLLCRSPPVRCCSRPSPLPGTTSIARGASRNDAGRAWPVRWW